MRGRGGVGGECGIREQGEQARGGGALALDQPCFAQVAG